MTIEPLKEKKPTPIEEANKKWLVRKERRKMTQAQKMPFYMPKKKEQLYDIL